MAKAPVGGDAISTPPKPEISRNQICDEWSWCSNCSSGECPKQHDCIVCKHSDHQTLVCPKRKFPVPARRKDPPAQAWLPDTTSPPPASSRLLSASTTSSSSHCPHLFPLKLLLTLHFIALHSWLQNSSGPTPTLRLPVPSNLNIPKWCRCLHDYPDKSLCDFLEFGWPVGHTSSTLPVQSIQNHGSSRSTPTVIDDFLSSESELGTTCGPFVTSPLSIDMSIAPLQIAYCRTGKRRVVLDLCYPPGQSANCGILRDTYLGELFSLCLPGLDALLDIIGQKGQHCHLFKKDLSRTYRQLRIDPYDYHLSGYQHRDYLYFNIAPPFGLRSSAMMCQTTTSAVTFMYKNLGYSCTNYIDDFGGGETPSKSAAAFQALGDLLHCLGLCTSPERIHLRLLQWSSSVSSSLWLRWPSPSLLTAFQSFIPAAHLCSPRRMFYDTTCSPCLASCPLSPPVYVPPAFLCCHYFTPSDNTGCPNTACFQESLFYRTTMVSRSLTLRLDLMIISSSPRTHAPPARGTISTGSTFTPLSPAPFSASLNMTLISWNCWWQWSRLSSGVSFHVANMLFRSVIMRTACLPSILDVVTFLGCIFVYGKSGFSPLVRILTSLPGMLRKWKTPSLITSVVGIHLQFITRALPSWQPTRPPNTFYVHLICFNSRLTANLVLSLPLKAFLLTSPTHHLHPRILSFSTVFLRYKIRLTLQGLCATYTLTGIPSTGSAKLSCKFLSRHFLWPFPHTRFS